MAISVATSRGCFAGDMDYRMAHSGEWDTGGLGRSDGLGGELYESPVFWLGGRAVVPSTNIAGAAPFASQFAPNIIEVVEMCAS